MRFPFGGKKRKDQPESAQPDQPESGDGSTFLTGDDERDQKSLRILLDTITDVSSTIDLDALLVDIVDKSIEVTKAERGILLLHIKGGEDKLQVRVARDSQRRDLGAEVQFSTSVSGKVAKERMPLRSMVRSDREAMDLGQSVFDLKLRAVMCVPLIAKERVLGVIYVDSRAEKREFSKGDLSFFAALSNQIAVSLENARLHKDSVTKARMEQDLEIARQIQSHLIPKAPKDIPGLEISGWYRPADEATGDSYDFVELEDQRLALMMGDASGHGVGAALITHTVQASIRSYLELLTDPGEVVRRLNNRLVSRVETGTFMSLFLGVLDVSKWTLSYVNAGHPGAWILRGGEVISLKENAMALGIMDEQEFGTVGPVQLYAGDMLFLCTDGLLELRDPDDGIFGDQRVTEALIGESGRSTREVLEAILAAGNKFRGARGPEDDWTMVAIRIHAGASHE